MPRPVKSVLKRPSESMHSDLMVSVGLSLALMLFILRNPQKRGGGFSRGIVRHPGSVTCFRVLGSTRLSTAFRTPGVTASNTTETSAQTWVAGRNRASTTTGADSRGTAMVWKSCHRVKAKVARWSIIPPNNRSATSVGN